MKKILFTLSLVFSTFLLSHLVFADTLNVSYFYDNFDSDISYYLEHQSVFETLLTYYETNYKNTYPYFTISIHYDSGTPSGFVLTSSKNNDTSWEGLSSPEYSFHDKSPTTTINTLFISENGSITSDNSFSYALFTHFDNTLAVNLLTNITFNGSSHNDPDVLHFDTLMLPQFTSQTLDTSILAIDIEEGMTFPSYLSLYDGSYQDDNLVYYQEVDLNDYAYVALSLKDYSVSQPFTTSIYVKGQLCATPVYDYGMQEKTSYYSGYQVDRCSPYYSDFTLNRFYILQQDLDNHAIFYLKAYDTEKPNVVKVDTRIFDVTPISQANANNPSVMIDGRSYPTIPYDDLSSTATKSEEEGYISGQVQNVFDVSSDSNFITNLFSNPLQALSNVWQSILTMFSLIGSFIGLLPPTLQAFLFTAFSLALIIGIIKILL